MLRFASPDRVSTQANANLKPAYDMYQEKVLGQGPQNNESALEQRQDEMTTDFIRQGATRVTGGDYLPKDK